ncbi:thermophilic metalloprotease (M29) [Yimella lutea]|uniref:Thermophilic metalloprotease (M29) n=1 Tax=Yimella lutea TaxID=587872 RepID=A0A542EGI4_9MICO|nr:aminopeptidase [Yimella lutea]TQJ14451.1 thermophilic metalloprotease (M29) [Yimella lutea]
MHTAVNDLSLREGVTRLLDSYIGVSSHDHVLLAYTPDSRRYAAAVSLELAGRGIRHTTFPMLPLEDPGLRDRLACVLPDPASFRGSFVALTLELDTMSHFDEFSDIIDAYGAARAKVVRIISATEELFTSGLALSPTVMERLNATLMAWLRDARSVHLSNEAGTDLTVELDQDRYDWISNRGRHRPGAFLVLPPGEIATYPARVNGIYCPDGAINCNVLTELDVLLADAALRLEIVDSRVVSFQTTRDDVRQFLSSAFAQEHGNRIGELGFGTNRALHRFIPHNSHLNERFPGIHLGIGQHNQTLENVPYYCPTHIDLVATRARITKESGETLDLASFPPDPSVEHPRLVRDQDVNGDCCSSGCSLVTLPTRGTGPEAVVIG